MRSITSQSTGIHQQEIEVVFSEVLGGVNHDHILLHIRAKPTDYINHEPNNKIVEGWMEQLIKLLQRYARIEKENTSFLQTFHLDGDHPISVGIEFNFIPLRYAPVSYS
ncbi:MAG TPA: hypothetical protein VK338_04080 [Candidatus Nitrosocosmicus sp.]|nr:hypothetical protein [Candidatus Nitrosocosmicus sp.]